jgi:hypothetical protein
MLLTSQRCCAMTMKATLQPVQPHTAWTTWDINLSSTRLAPPCGRAVVLPAQTHCPAAAMHYTQTVQNKQQW